MKKAWLRELRKLDDDVLVSMTELACRNDGGPDIETVIDIMRPGETIDFRIHGPFAETKREDVAAVVSDRNLSRRGPTSA